MLLKEESTLCKLDHSCWNINSEVPKFGGQLKVLEELVPENT